MLVKGETLLDLHERMRWEEWENVRKTHLEGSEILDAVPPWGQDLLVELFVHHPPSFEHTLRVAEVVKPLSEESIEDVSPEQLVLSAVIHDALKTAIPGRILDDPENLSPEKREILPIHTNELFKAVVRHDPVVAAVGAGHHLPTQGYAYPGAEIAPNGIKRARIIVATADVVDALASRRGYKEPWPAERVRSTMLADGNLPRGLIDRAVTVRFGM